jgi:hypothetical protein
MACRGYSLVVIRFVTQMRRGKDLLVPDLPWYSRKKKITVSDMLAAARRSHFQPIFSREHGLSLTAAKYPIARFQTNDHICQRARLR